jgi:hypothetical protein
MVGYDNKGVFIQVLVAGAYLGFCQGGCTFLADLPSPPPPPDLDLDPDPDPHQDFDPH